MLVHLGYSTSLESPKDAAVGVRSGRTLSPLAPVIVGAEFEAAQASGTPAGTAAAAAPSKGQRAAPPARLLATAMRLRGATRARPRCGRLIVLPLRGGAERSGWVHRRVKRHLRESPTLEHSGPHMP